MTKQTIVIQLTDNYTAFVDYINSLTDEEYSRSIPGKWSAMQQLAHIVLCIKPLVKVFGMTRIAIAQNFGTTDNYGHGRTYDVLLNDYRTILSEGGKAPERFLPEASSPVGRVH